MKVRVLLAATNNCNKTPTFLRHDNEFLDASASLEPTQVVLSELLHSFCTILYMLLIFLHVSQFGTLSTYMHNFVYFATFCISCPVCQFFTNLAHFAQYCKLCTKFAHFAQIHTFCTILHILQIFAQICLL